MAADNIPVLPALGIEAISVFGMPPVAFVELAADLGCQHISSGLSSYSFGVEDYPAFSLRDDAKLRREMIAVMRDRGISISLAEGCNIREGGDVRSYAADLDLFVDLGAERINCVSMDSDLSRTCDQLSVLTEMASQRGIRVTIESVPAMTIPDLPMALEVIRQVGSPNLRLLIDTMHFARSGGTAAELAALDPEVIDYIQLCDAPAMPSVDSYFEESMFERMAPGEGGLQIKELLKILPRDRIYALEIPQRALALQGVGPSERLAKCVTATRGLFEDLV